LCGFPAGLLDIFFNLVAEFDLQLLSLQLQHLLPVTQSSAGLWEVESGTGVRNRISQLLI